MRGEEKNRREFLKESALLFAVAGAFAFGESIGKEGEGKSGKSAILYGTRYGATRETAGWIADGMGGGVDLLDIERDDCGDLASRYECLIIGSGIWIDGPHRGITGLLNKQGGALGSKVVASFVVCGSTPDDEAGRRRIEGYLRRLEAPLPSPPSLRRAFGGWMLIARLNEKDRKLLEHFYRRIINKPFRDWDRTDPSGARDFGSDISVR